MSQQITVLKRIKKNCFCQNCGKRFIKLSLLINYCAESWHFCSKCLTAKLKKNERALRFVYLGKTSFYKTLVVENGYCHFSKSTTSKNVKHGTTNYNLRGNG